MLNLFAARQPAWLGQALQLISAGLEAPRLTLLPLTTASRSGAGTVPADRPKPTSKAGGGALKPFKEEASRAGSRVETVSFGRLTWVNIEKPTPVEIDWLRENYSSFHPLDLEDCLSKIQRPKIDEYDDYMFIVLHFPVYDRRLRMTVPSEVDIFVGDGYLITLHNGDLRPLNRLFTECQADEVRRQEIMGRSCGYLLYQVIDRLVDYCFPILNKIGSNIDRVEDNVFADDARDIIRELSIIRRDVIAFRRIIKPQIAIIASLEHKDRPFLREDLDVYWGNISDHVAKMWDILDDHREVIEGLSATSESLNTYRMNEVIKVLTLISTIMLPIAVISGIYGMNISVLPFAETPLSFTITVGSMVLVLVAMLSYFRLRRWI